MNRQIEVKILLLVEKDLPLKVVEEDVKEILLDGFEGDFYNEMTFEVKSIEVKEKD